MFSGQSPVYMRTENRKALTDLLVNFSKNVITPIIPHDQLYPSCHTPIQPSSDNDELKNIQTSLQALTKAVAGLQKKATPTVNTPPTQPPKSQPTYASKASSKPANPV
jgi:hypothetical protein